MTAVSEKRVVIGAFVISSVALGLFETLVATVVNMFVIHRLYESLGSSAASHAVNLIFIVEIAVAFPLAVLLFAALIGPWKGWVAFLLPFDGRVGRKDYWLKYVLVFVPMNFCAMLPIWAPVIARWLSSDVGENFVAYVPPWMLLTYLVSLWAYFSVSIRRCHDRNHSGWFLLVGLIPFVGGVWLLIELGFLRGTAGRNGYGEDPLAPV